ncbi:MAG: ATP-binding cassette domain-containing protein [Tissierellia bacterium]|nr:ATP-binding cassette domain-containing protein [Tissierellia bacterium]
MIETKNLNFYYKDGTLGVSDVNLNIGEGEKVFITGESGSGKSTFLKLILGIVKPSEGEFTVLGRDMNKLSKGELRLLRTEIGPVFQEFRLIKGRTALENVAISLRFTDVKKKDIYTRSKDFLTRVGLEEKMKTLVDNLSYGQLQRVAVARALARNPKLLIADEPTGNLDHDNAINTIKLLTDLKEDHQTVIITTHQTGLIPTDGDIRRLTVKRGQIEDV